MERRRQRVEVATVKVGEFNQPKQRVVYKVGEEESASKMEWVGRSFRGDL